MENSLLTKKITILSDNFYFKTGHYFGLAYPQ